MRRGGRFFIPRIAGRVLAFNALIVFLPIAGMLSLDTYEKQLLISLERALVQQGRLVAASLEDAGPNLQKSATQLLERLRQRRDARIRVVDNHGLLVADSSQIGTLEADILAGTPLGTAQNEPDQPAAKAAQETFLYQFASFPIRLWRRYLRPPQPPAESDEFYSGARVFDGPEITDALAGNYGAETRITAGQQSVTLYSAIPVRQKGVVTGAVLVSQSTFRILSDLYALRLDIFRLFLWSIVTAVVLSLLVSATITVPIRRLRDQARAILDPRGRLRGVFTPSRARDEVGELSRGLGELTARLERHVRLLESFASDVSHELKNPLASIRASTEIALSSTDPAERAAMLGMVLDDVHRMERLLAGVREISRIDSGSAEETQQDPVAVLEIARRVAAAVRLRRQPGDSVTFDVRGVEAAVWVPAIRLQQVLENLLENAADFSPRGGTVSLCVAKAGDRVVIQVCDDGPGIPPEHAERIFDRFFTFRPGVEKGVHAGLGLSIVKAIAESHAGSVRFQNRPATASGAFAGACFEVELPAAPVPAAAT